MKKLSPLKIIIIFLVSGQLWIILTDLLVANVATSPEMITKLSVIKGWLYNAVLGLLLYWLISRYASARDRAEEALRNSERSYKTLSENLPGIIYRVFMRENNRMQFFNKTAFEITGYHDSELSEGIICSLEKLILDEDRPNVIAVVENAIAAHKPFSIEYRLRHKDGTIRFLLEKGTPIYGPDEKILFIDGVIFEITERKRFEQQTKDTLNFIRTMMENSPVGIVSIKATGAVVATNEAMARISGGTVEQLLKQNVRSLEAWKNYGLLSSMDEALSTNSEKRIETHYVSTFGKDLWLSVSFVPYTFAGEPHVLAMFADMANGSVTRSKRNGS
jgi:PAS domain S-box-containing protein